MHRFLKKMNVSHMSQWISLFKVLFRSHKSLPVHGSQSKWCDFGHGHLDTILLMPASDRGQHSCLIQYGAFGTWILSLRVYKHDILNTIKWPPCFLQCSEELGLRVDIFMLTLSIVGLNRVLANRIWALTQPWDGAAWILPASKTYLTKRRDKLTCLNLFS